MRFLIVLLLHRESGCNHKTMKENSNRKISKICMASGKYLIGKRIYSLGSQKYSLTSQKYSLGSGKYSLGRRIQTLYFLIYHIEINAFGNFLIKVALTGSNLIWQLHLKFSLMQFVLSIISIKAFAITAIN